MGSQFFAPAQFPGVPMHSSVSLIGWFAHALMNICPTTPAHFPGVPMRSSVSVVGRFARINDINSWLDEMVRKYPDKAEIFVAGKSYQVKGKRFWKYNLEEKKKKNNGSRRVQLETYMNNEPLMLHLI